MCIKIQIFSFNQMHSQMMSVKCRPLWLNMASDVASISMALYHHDLSGAKPLRDQTIPITLAEYCPSWLRDHFEYAPNQWETMLPCNVVSHRLGPYTKWSLWVLNFALNTVSYHHQCRHICDILSSFSPKIMAQLQKKIFSIGYIQMHFVKEFFLSYIWFEFHRSLFYECVADNKLSIIQGQAWHWIGDKSLPDNDDSIHWHGNVSPLIRKNICYDTEM